jgi:5'-hydroxyaverantin dehydrogenase
MPLTATPCVPLAQALDLFNKSVLITGGASGLGLATVRAVAAVGAYVTIATNVPTHPDTLRSLQTSGSHVQEVLCDVSDWNSLLGVFKAALAFSPTGTLDVVAMFAAVDSGTHLVDQIAATDMAADPSPPGTAELDVNLKGALYTTALALHYFRLPSKSGKDSPRAEDKTLIFVSSLAGYIDDTHNSVYTTSKFGMRGLWRSIRARAAAEMGVRCNLIAPWAVKTPMTAPILKAMDQMGIKEGAGITFATEETVVQAVVRCIGDGSVSGKSREGDIW